mmetsp:Transcript_17342/g.49284  ORF Transcript_17342/g.49284 Transcript_17342/m.49284 type:complete len:205 (+) Transcript_17342:225-839(+)
MQSPGLTRGRSATAVELALAPRKLEAHAAGLVRELLARTPMVEGARELTLVLADHALGRGLSALRQVSVDGLAQGATRLRASVDAIRREGLDLPHEAAVASALGLAVVLRVHLERLRLQGVQRTYRGLVAIAAADLVVRKGLIDLRVGDGLVRDGVPREGQEGRGDDGLTERRHCAKAVGRRARSLNRTGVRLEVMEVRDGFLD